jgi:LuxR family maltose regulon positive regulatory protein
VLTYLELSNGRFAVNALSRLIELYPYQGKPEQARPLVEELRRFGLLVGFPFIRDQVVALDAYLAMACGDLPGALSWVLGGIHDSLEKTLYHQLDRIPFTRCRILLAEGSPASLHEASHILQELVRFQENHYMWFHLVDTLVVQALTWAGLGQTELALTALGRAVQRAVPNGIIGPFIRQGQPLRRLLHALEQQEEYSSLVKLLLTTYPLESAVQMAVETIDPLTERELDILRLLAGGFSNKEIAQRLFLSANTVRNYTATIYDKLQVENRLQAVERAHAVGLLPFVDKDLASAPPKRQMVSPLHRKRSM